MTQMAAPSWYDDLRVELETRLAEKRHNDLRVELETRLKDKRIAEENERFGIGGQPRGKVVYAETGEPVGGYEPPVADLRGMIYTGPPPPRDNMPTPAVAPWRGGEVLDPENLPLDEAAMRSVLRGVGGLVNAAGGAARFAGETGLSTAFAPSVPPYQVAQGAGVVGGFAGDVFSGAAPSESVAGHEAGIGRLLVERGPEALVGTAPLLAAGAVGGPVPAAVAMGLTGASNQYQASRGLERPVGESAVDAGVQGIIDGAFGLIPAKNLFGAGTRAGGVLSRMVSGATNMAGAGAGQRVATAVAQRVRDIDPEALARLPDELKEGLVVDTALGALLGAAHNRPQANDSGRPALTPEQAGTSFRVPADIQKRSEAMDRIRAEARAEIERLGAEQADGSPQAEPGPAPDRGQTTQSKQVLAADQAEPSAQTAATRPNTPERPAPADGTVREPESVVGRPAEALPDSTVPEIAVDQPPTPAPVEAPVPPETPGTTSGEPGGALGANRRSMKELRDEARELGHTGPLPRSKEKVAALIDGLRKERADAEGLDTAPGQAAEDGVRAADAERAVGSEVADAPRVLAMERPVPAVVEPARAPEQGQAGVVGGEVSGSAFKRGRERNRGPTPEEVSAFFDDAVRSPDDDGSMIGALTHDARTPVTIPDGWADASAPKRKGEPESHKMTMPEIARVSESRGFDVTAIKPEGIEIARGRSTLEKVRSGATSRIRPYIEMLADAMALVRGKNAKSIVSVLGADLRPGDSFVLGDRRMAVERRSASELLINDQQGRTFRVSHKDFIPMESGTFREFGNRPLTKKEADALSRPSDAAVQRGKALAEKVKAAKPRKFGDVVLERAGKAKAAAKSRIRSDEAAIAKLRSEGKGRSIGAAPIFARAFNEAVIAASEAVEAAVLGGRKLQAIIERAAARIPKEYGDQTRAVSRVVRAILKDVRVGKAYDTERFEAAVADARKAVPSSQKPAEVKANVRAATGQAAQQPTVRESEALAAAFKKAQAASAAGFRAGEAKAKANARVVLATVRAATKMSNANEKAIRERLVDTVNKAMPPALRGKMNRAIARAKSLADISRAADRIEAVVATSEAKADSRWIGRNTSDRAMRITHKLTEPERVSVKALADQAAIRAGMLKQEGKRGRKANWVAMRDHANRIADIKNEIKETIHNRRMEGKIIANGRVQSVKKIQADINAALVKIGTGRYGPNDPDVGALKKYIRWGMQDSTFAALIDRTPNGPAHRELVQKIRTATNKATRVERMNSEQGEQIVKAHGYRSMLDFDAQVGGVMGRANQTFVPMTKGGRQLSLGEAMNILAADAQTMERILSGRRFVFDDNPNGTEFSFDSHDIASLQQHVGADNMKLIGAVKALREKLILSDLKKAFRESHGHDMADIPGQWPTHANRKGSDSRQIPTGIRNIVRHFLEQSGRVRDREGEAQSYLIGNFRNEWNNAVRAEAAIAHLATPIRNAGMVFLTGDTKSNLVGALGEHAARVVEESLDRASGVARPQESTFDRLIDTVRGNAGRAYVSLNLGTAFKQVLSSAKLLGHFNARDLSWALTQVFRRGLIDDMAKANPYLWKRYIESSPYALLGAQQSHPSGTTAHGTKALGESVEVLRMAGKSLRGIVTEPRRAFGHTKDVATKDVQSLLDHIRLISWADSVPARIAYLAGYHESVRNNPNRTAAGHARHAGRRAETATRDLQNPTDGIDYPRWGIDAKKSGMLRAAMQFKTEGDTNRNVLMRMHLTGELYTPGGAAKAAGVLASILTSAAITGLWAKGAVIAGSELYGTMDRKKRKALENDAVKSAALDAIRSFGAGPGPFFDELAQVIGSKVLGGKFSDANLQGPVVGTLNKAVTTTGRVIDAAAKSGKTEKEKREATERLYKALLDQSEALSTVFGFPIPPTVGKAARTWRDIHSRKYLPQFSQ